MIFRNPLLLLLIPLLLLTIIPLLIYRNKKNSDGLKKFIGNNKKLMPEISNKINIIKQVIILIALVLLVIVMAKPINGYKKHDVTTTGIDIVVAIDTSRSMNAIDIAPDRLSRAKLALLDLSDNLDADRIALLPFAGSSFVMTPFTADYNVFNESVESLNTAIIPKGGTNLKSAIATANDLFKENNKHKILILITDGEDLANKGIEEAKKVAEKGVQIFTVGVGTQEGELIPDPENKGRYLRDKRGKLVKSRLDEKSLENIAKITGGEYKHILSGGNGILEIYKQKLNLIEKNSRDESRNREPIYNYRIFLISALILLLLEFLLSTLVGRSGKKTLIAIVFLLNAASLFSTQGDRAYKKENYSKAIDLYKKEKETPETLYNLGSAYYKEKKYDESIESFTRSLERSSGELQKKTLYNLGNSYYRKSTITEDMNEKIELLTSSVGSYKGAMELNNTDDQVKKNHDFVKKILDDLKDQQNKDQQNQDQQNQDQQNQDQQNQDQQNQDQQNQDQQNQDQQNQDQQNQDQQNQDQQNQDQQNQDQQNQEQQNQDQQNQDQQNQEQQNKDQQNKDQQNKDQQNKDQKNQDQQSQQNQEPKTALSPEDAEALLKALESEDVKFQLLQSNHDNSYTGDW